MSDIDQVFEETRQAYYRALAELQEKFAAEFGQLVAEENKTLGSEAKHMAKTLRYETAKTRREHLQG